MSKQGKVIALIVISLVLLTVIGVLIYQYSSLNNENTELNNKNTVLEENNETLTEEINTLQKEQTTNNEDNNENIDPEKIKTDREKLHQELDETVKQFLEARYVINDQTKHTRYEQAKNVSTDEALDKYFEEAIKMVDEDTELREYSNLENYKSYASLGDINTSNTTVLAQGKQVLKSDSDSAENITNFLFEVSLVMEDKEWKVNEITVKDITLYDN